MNFAKQLSLSNLSEDEKNARAAAAVTQYGTGTRSYNRSTEKREMDRQREETTAKYHSGELKIHDCSKAFLLCYCRSFEHGHSPALHDDLRADYDWRSPEERKKHLLQGRCAVTEPTSHQRRRKPRDPEKQRARARVYSEVRSGRLVRPKICEECGLPGDIEAHHVDYSKPLSVEWLCSGCHVYRHKYTELAPKIQKTRTPRRKRMQLNSAGRPAWAWVDGSGKTVAIGSDRDALERMGDRFQGCRLLNSTIG